MKKDKYRKLTHEETGHTRRNLQAQEITLLDLQKQIEIQTFKRDNISPYLHQQEQKGLTKDIQRLTNEIDQSKKIIHITTEQLEKGVKQK